MQPMNTIAAYITWNPDKALIDLGFYELRWYSLLFATGFVLSYFILKRIFKKEGIPENKLESLTIYVVVGTVVGARLGHCLFYDFDYYSQHIAEIFLPFRFEPEFEFVGYQGLASHGGAIGIFIALILYSRNQKMNLWLTLDRLAVVAPLAGTCIRLGNLMNSEIVGKPADVAWAFVFVQVDAIPRHPGQLYEALAYLLIFGVMIYSYRKFRKRPGFIFGLFLTLMFTARFVIEFFKADQSDFEAGMAINMGQTLSIPFVILGLLLMFLKNRPKR